MLSTTTWGSGMARIARRPSWAGRTWVGPTRRRVSSCRSIVHLPAQEVEPVDREPHALALPDACASGQNVTTAFVLGSRHQLGRAPRHVRWSAARRASARPRGRLRPDARVGSTIRRSRTAAFMIDETMLWVDADCVAGASSSDDLGTAGTHPTAPMTGCRWGGSWSAAGRRSTG